MIGVQLGSVISTNDAGKQLSTDMYDRNAFKESKCYFSETVQKHSWYCFTGYCCTQFASAN